MVSLGSRVVLWPWPSRLLPHTGTVHSQQLVNGFRNYPFRRVPGDLELDLADGTGDGAYLEGLGRLLPQAVARSRPDLCFYLGGADPYEGDRLGRLALTRDGLAARDRLVRDALARAGVPVCVTLAGGYADPIEDTVEINLTTLRVFASPSSPEGRAGSAPPPRGS